MREFTSVAEMMAHYKAVRERLRGPEPPLRRLRVVVKPPVPPVPSSIPIRPPVLVREFDDSPIGKTANALRLYVIVRMIEQHYGVQHGDLKQTIRTAKTVEPRQIAYYLLREMGGASLMKIARILDRDHTTVLHGINKANERLQRDNAFAERVATITQQIRERIT